MTRRLVITLVLALAPLAGTRQGHAQSSPDVTLTGVIQGSNGLPASNVLISFTPTQTFYIQGTGVIPPAGGCTSVGFHTLQMSDGSGGCLTTNSQYNVGGDLSFTFGVATPAGFTANTGDLGFAVHSTGGGIQLLDASGGVQIRSDTGGVSLLGTSGGMSLRMPSGGIELFSDSIGLDATDAVLVSAGGHGLLLDSGGTVAGQDDIVFTAQTNRYEFVKGSTFTHPLGHIDLDTSNIITGDAFVVTMPRQSGQLALIDSSVTAGTGPVCPNGTGGILTTVGCAGGGGGGATLQTNGVNNTSQVLLNFVNPSAFNGLTFTFSNPSGGIETFAVGGTLGNAGLTNPSMTINGTTCTLGASCTVSGGGTVASVANGDGTLTISPTTGSVVASLALGHANTWTGLQTLVATNVTGLPLATGVIGNLAVSHLNSGTGASSSTFWRGDGTWASATGSTGISGGTLGFVPLFGSSTTITGNSHLDEVTTAGVDTFTQPVAVNDGTGKAGNIGLLAGTAPSAAPANTIQINAPTAVTAYAINLPGAQPTGGSPFLSCTAANPAVCSWAAGGGTATLVASEESVAFSATPTFSTAFRESTITLTAAITSFTLAAGTAGQEKTLTFCENGTGGFAVTPPANVHGFMSITSSATASKCNSQHYTYNSIVPAWIADSPGVINQ